MRNRRFKVETGVKATALFHIRKCFVTPLLAYYIVMPWKLLLSPHFPFHPFRRLVSSPLPPSSIDILRRPRRSIPFQLIRVVIFYWRFLTHRLRPFLFSTRIDRFRVSRCFLSLSSLTYDCRLKLLVFYKFSFLQGMLVYFWRPWLYARPLILVLIHTIISRQIF